MMRSRAEGGRDGGRRERGLRCCGGKTTCCGASRLQREDELLNTELHTLEVSDKVIGEQRKENMEGGLRCCRGSARIRAGERKRCQWREGGERADMLRSISSAEGGRVVEHGAALG
eukprot:2853469-Rhodomonas_salina.1